MLLRLSVLVSGIMLIAISGCSKSAPTAASRTSATPVVVLPSNPEGDEQKLAALAQKFSLLHTSNSAFALETIPGTYFSFRENSAPSDALLAEIATELKDVKQPVLLDLKECENLTVASLSQLVEVKCLSGIYLKGNGIRELLPTVAKMTQLHYLMLVDDSLVDADLAPIASLVNLRGLVVVGGLHTFTAAAYKHLANMTELEFLYGSLTSQIDFTDSELAYVSKLNKLKKFVIRARSDGKLSDRGLANLKGMANLETLRIGLTPDITEESLAVIGGLKKLRDLELFAASSIGMKTLEVWPPRGIDKLLPLAGQLKTLEINRSSLASDGSPASVDKTWLDTIAKFTGLERLELEGTGIGDKNLTFLSGMINLQKLNLGNNPITGLGFAQLKPLVELQDLDLQSTALSDASAAAIKELQPSVTTINVRGTKITKPVLDDLEKSRKWNFFFR